MQTKIFLDHTPARDGRHLVRLLVKLAGTPPEPGARTPLNIALVLDRSGSMAGEKLEAARQAAVQLVRRLWPEDVVSVVAYDDAVTTVAEPASGAAQADLGRRIAAIVAGGTTNLSGGWLRGRELVAGSAGAGRISRVLLLTDGLANVGITDAQLLAGLTASARERGITTTTIGFGEGYDERLLQAMADAGGGAMYFIEHADQTAAIFNEELHDLLDTTAQNVAVTIEPTAGVEVAAVRHAYPCIVDGATVRLQIGDLYAREPRTLLVEFLVAAGASGKSSAVATLTIRGDVIHDRHVTTETITVPLTIDAAGSARIDPEIEREALILEAARARTEALEDRARGDYDAASAKLTSVADRLAASGLNDLQLREEADDLVETSHSFTANTVMAADEKYLNQRAYDSVRGRSRKARLISRRPNPPAE